MRTLWIAALVLSLAGCTPEEISQFQPALQSAQQQDSPGDSAPDATQGASSPCWYEGMALNGAENLSYPGPSRAAGNTFYACYGNDASGHEQGVWTAFYSDGTAYYGLPGITAVPNKDAAACSISWSGYGSISGGQLNASGQIVSLDLSHAAYGEVIHMTCHMEN